MNIHRSALHLKGAYSLWSPTATMDRMPDADGVELYDVIRKVRNDLSRAMWESEDKDLRFRIDSVELQLEVAVSRSSKAGATVKLVVLDADGSRESSHTTRHHIKV